MNEQIQGYLDLDWSNQHVVRTCAVSSQWPLSVYKVLVARLYVSVLTRSSAPAQRHVESVYWFNYLCLFVILFSIYILFDIVFSLFIIACRPLWLLAIIAWSSANLNALINLPPTSIPSSMIITYYFSDKLLYIDLKK